MLQKIVRKSEKKHKNKQKKDERDRLKLRGKRERHEHGRSILCVQSGMVCKTEDKMCGLKNPMQKKIKGTLMHPCILY